MFANGSGPKVQSDGGCKVFRIQNFYVIFKKKKKLFYIIFKILLLFWVNM